MRKLLTMGRRTEWLIVASVMVLGLALRVAEAKETYLNPDEIHHVFLALRGSLKEVYRGVALEVDHPPLLFFLLHPIAAVTSSEILLRLPAVLAGTLFPWVVYRWLSRIWNRGAGLAALVILTLSPNLILLSAQIRGYTIELLFAAMALLFLDMALGNGSIGAMILFDISLDLAILSEYSAAWFAGAVGIYFLLRARDRKVSTGVLVLWSVGQLSALGIYGALYWTLVRPQLASKQALMDGFLRGGFPEAHQSLLAFGALATLKQFAYVFSSIVLGMGAAVLFAAALVILWKGRSPSERPRNRIFATLLVAPFLLACGGAWVKVHPYGRSRHTVILSLFAAAGVSIALERIFRKRPWIAGPAALTLGLTWMFAGDSDQNNIPRSQNHKSSMIAAMRYMESSIPPGALVLANKGTAAYIRFYAPSRRRLLASADYNSQENPPAGSFRVVWRRWDFGEVEDLQGDLASVRREFGLNPDAPVWVVDGGFDSGIDSRLRQRVPGIFLPDFHSFDGAVTIFRNPPGL